ncbi:DegV family protein [Sanguibacter sp. 25GB23B1]|uniref:DegV family protein n=1 Tax=unclassified Sanguibacter TaxID=2645534 RepID=UPI0032AFE741
MSSSTSPTRTVHVVTDSTCSLPADLARRWGVHVVPLQVVVDGRAHLEGVDLSTGDLVRALDDHASLSTSQPTPRAFAEAYERAAGEGAERIVSLHLSGELSGTVHAAALAARDASVPVDVVDSRTVAMGLGFAVLAAAREAAHGASGPVVARTALRVASSSTAMFVVDSLDHLRRGGRLSATSAAIGTALGLRPVLGLRAGHVEVVQKIRTRAAVVERLVAAGIAAAQEDVDTRIAMHHLGDDSVVWECAGRITDATGREVVVSPVSAVLGAHVGPGLLALITARDLPPADVPHSAPGSSPSHR